MFSEEKESSRYDDMSVSIKYYDRTMYYPGNPDTNPVFVHISIKNNSARTMRFKLADDRMFSVDFNGYTIKNLQIPQTENVIRKRTTNQTVYFREISLETGEEYSFVENLKDYIEISEPSVYYVELKFYPELYKSKYLSVTSNRLSLEIRPSPSAASSAVLPVKNKSAELLKPEEISPDKVVEQTIIIVGKCLGQVDNLLLTMSIGYNDFVVIILALRESLTGKAEKCCGYKYQ